MSVLLWSLRFVRALSTTVPPRPRSLMSVSCEYALTRALGKSSASSERPSASNESCGAAYRGLVEYTIEFGAGEPQDLTVTMWGVADVTTLRRFNADLTANPSYRGGLLMLAETSDLDLSGLS